MSRLTFFSTWFSPKKTDRFRAVKAKASEDVCVVPCGAAWGSGRNSAIAFWLSAVMLPSLLVLPEPVPGQEAYTHVNRSHEQQQHQRTGPGLAMPVFVGRDGVVENLQWQRGDGIGQLM